MAILASDQFQRANESPLSNGGNWTTPINGGAQVNLVSNLAVASSTTVESRAFWTGLVWPNDQYSEVVIGTGFVSTTSVDASVRFTTNNAVNTGYRFIVQPTIWTLFKNLNGVGIVLASGSGTFAVGDTIRLEVQGTNLVGKKNGNVIVGPISDSDISSGRAGFGLFETSVASNAKISSWVGGNFIGPSFYSVPDNRNYGNFPNLSRNVQGTLTYDVPRVFSLKWWFDTLFNRTQPQPVDSRAAGAPVDSRNSGNVPQNSRNFPPF
jgi:hypothetical protein